MNKFSYDASQYTAYRPQYPDSLFEYLTKLADSNGLVLDCGTGSGQTIQGLSHHFKRVIATDLSFGLLLKAPSLPNVNYLQSSAEQLPLRSHCINLISVAQAMHWFSLNDFYNEVNRILKPGGVIAAWCYNQAVIESAVDHVINKIYLKITSSQNPSREREYLYNHYQTIPFPFERIITPNFTIEMNWNLLQLLGYLSTWPGILEYQKRFNIDVLSEIKDELISAWGNPSNEKSIVWPIYLLVGRKN